MHQKLIEPNQERIQRLESIKVGIVDIKGVTHDADVDALVEWIVTDRLAIVTGNFGPMHHTDVSQVAQRAGAIFSTILYQEVHWYSTRSRGPGACFRHPS